MRHLFFITLLVFLLLAASFGIAGRQVSDSLFELNPGENASIALGEFSRYSVRVYEGSYVNVAVDQIQNKFIVDQVYPDGTTDVRISVDKGPFQKYTLALGANATHVNLYNQKIPFMTLEENVYSYNPDSSQRNTILYFNVPLFQTPEEYDAMFNQGKGNTTNASQQPVKTPAKDPYLKYVLVFVLLLILLNIALPYARARFLQNKIKK